MIGPLHSNIFEWPLADFQKPWVVFYRFHFYDWTLHSYFRWPSKCFIQLKDHSLLKVWLKTFGKRHEIGQKAGLELAEIFCRNRAEIGQKSFCTNRAEIGQKCSWHHFVQIGQKSGRNHFLQTGQKSGLEWAEYFFQKPGRNRAECRNIETGRKRA
jgi:hypothetical protein